MSVKARVQIEFIEDFERVSLGFGVGVVNSGKIDEGEETEDFDEDLKDLRFNFIIVTFRVTTLLQTIMIKQFGIYRK